MKEQNHVSEELDPDQETERHSLVKSSSKFWSLREGKNTFQLKGSKSLMNERKSDYSQTLIQSFMPVEKAVAYLI